MRAGFLFCFIFILSSVFNLFASLTYASSTPVIFYSDLTSGPNIGGKDNKGVFVTVWGNHFGAVQGNSYVTVGGAKVDNYPEWSESSICFQLGPNAASGDIEVVVDDLNSNSLPFVVRSGNIYFVSPDGSGDGSFSDPFSPGDYITRLEAGEVGATAYFRAGTYDGEYAHINWYSNFCLTQEHSGADGAENAFVGYPGETALVTVSDSGNATKFNFRLYSQPAQYILISKLKLYALQGSTQAHTGWRVIGNEVDAIHTPSATGSLSTGLYQDATPHHIYIYGNEISGGSSGDKLDHAIYPGSGVNNLYIGWNYIHDNNFAQGPMVSLNCNAAYVNNLVSKEIYIHDNIVDVTAHPSRVFGVFETGEGSEIFYYNNLIIGAASDSNPTLYALSGNVSYYNNTINNGGGSAGGSFFFYSGAASGHTYSPESITIRNNIVYANADALYYVGLKGSVPDPVIENNLFYNLDTPSADDWYAADANKVVADPEFVNAAKGNFSVNTTSPAVGKAQAISLVKTDIVGTARPQNPTIGAYEAGSTPIMPPSQGSSLLNLILPAAINAGSR